MKKIFMISILFACSLTLFGCATTQERLFDSDQSQVQLRSIQSRIFETTDKEKTLRTVIATMQDLGFVVDKADFILGTVTGTKLSHYNLRMTVSLRPRGEAHAIIRANAQFGNKPIVDAKHYQDFFAALEKAMFLTAHQVD